MTIQPITPGPGQESVWDYPRPPRLEQCSKRIQIQFEGTEIAASERALRILETSHPPTYYIPPSDIRMDLLAPSRQQSWCEWKGAATYYDLVLDDRVFPQVAWAYASPNRRFADLKDHLAFYCHKMTACFVGELQARPQAGGFYGGWITDDVVGPFKGEPGTHGW